MKESIIRKKIKNLLFEDRYPFIGKEEIKTPLEPEEHMATQLSTDIPPIDDGNFVPNSSTELAKSLYSLFKDLPDDQVEYTYIQAKKLFDEAIEKSKEISISDPKIDDTESFEKPIKI